MSTLFSENICLNMNTDIQLENIFKQVESVPNSVQPEMSAKEIATIISNSMIEVFKRELNVNTEEKK
jgi:hypothetical protein